MLIKISIEIQAHLARCAYISANLKRIG